MLCAILSKRHQKNVNLLISPINCCRIAFGSAKRDFQQYPTVIYIQQLIVQTFA